jgi:hypothetical protein
MRTVLSAGSTRPVTVAAGVQDHVDAMALL